MGLIPPGAWGRLPIVDTDVESIPANERSDVAAPLSFSPRVRAILLAQPLNPLVRIGFSTLPSRSGGGMNSERVQRNNQCEALVAGKALVVGLGLMVLTSGCVHWPGVDNHKKHSAAAPKVCQAAQPCGGL